MKKLFLGACTLTCAASLFSQGTVIFNNRIAGTLITHVYGPDPANIYNYVSGMGANDFPSGNTSWGGELLQGSGFSAQLWAAPFADAPKSALAPASPITSFRTGAGAGFLAGTTATLSAVPADATSATLVLRVWDNQGGTVTTWAVASNLGTGAFGENPEESYYKPHCIGPDYTIFIFADELPLSITPMPVGHKRYNNVVEFHPCQHGRMSANNPPFDPWGWPENPYVPTWYIAESSVPPLNGHCTLQGGDSGCPNAYLSAENVLVFFEGRLTTGPSGGQMQADMDSLSTALGLTPSNYQMTWVATEP